jgi:hypothetical protein
MSVAGFGGLPAGRTVTMIVLPVSAPTTVALIVAGAWLTSLPGSSVQVPRPVGSVG